MNKNPQCTFEVFLAGRWHQAAIMEILGEIASGSAARTRVTYLTDYALDARGRADAAALSATLPVSLDLTVLETWPAFAVDLLPQGYGRRELAARLGISPDHRSSDWQLLLAGAANPIGNLRVTEAIAYAKTQNTGATSHGFTHDAIVSRAESFMEYLATEGFFVAGSSGVQGEWPKILLTQDNGGLWHLDHLLPDEQAQKHWIVKFARGGDAVFRTILKEEAAYYRIAADLGLQTSEQLTHENGVLFIPRFDRSVMDGRTLRFAQESLYSLASKSGFDASLTHNEACAVIARYCTNPEADIAEYILRDVANVVLGNKDNHGRNTAFQRFEDGRVALSPLFDFAPMFLHPEGIARRMRWEKDDGGQPLWRSVAEQAAHAGGIDVNGLRRRLAGFADSIARLPVLLAQYGVSQEIIDRLRAGILENANRLRNV